MQSNCFLKQKDFVLSLPKEKKALINDKNIKDLELKLRVFLSVEDLKVTVNTDYDASHSPLSLKEEKLKKTNEIIEEKISNSKSYKKIVSELNPKIKNFDNSNLYGATNISLPMYPKLKNSEIDIICKNIKSAIE